MRIPQKDVIPNLQSSLPSKTQNSSFSRRMTMTMDKDITSSSRRCRQEMSCRPILTFINSRLLVVLLLFLAYFLPVSNCATTSSLRHSQVELLESGPGGRVHSHGHHDCNHAYPKPHEVSPTYHFSFIFHIFQAVKELIAIVRTIVKAANGKLHIK